MNRNATTRKWTISGTTILSLVPPYEARLARFISVYHQAGVLDGFAGKFAEAVEDKGGEYGTTTDMYEAAKWMRLSPGLPCKRSRPYPLRRRSP